MSPTTTSSPGRWSELSRLKAVIVAAAGPVGLGHLARSTSLAQALELRGVDVVPVAFGSESGLTLDGLDWSPGETGPAGADLAVIDGYEIDPTLPDALAARCTVWMHPPRTEPHTPPDLVIDLTGVDAPGRLAGLRFACLRRDYWSRRPRRARPQVRSLLVTVGGSDAGGPVGEVAARAAAALPDVRVTMVRGPQSRSGAPTGVEVLDRPATLAPLLASHDMVLTAAGQTLLESLCVGAPTLAMIRAANQQSQAKIAAAAGAARLLGPDEPLGAALQGLAADEEGRSALTERAQAVIDGLGAHRAADAILARAGSAGFRWGSLRLRLATPEDSEFLLALRNDPAAYPNYRNPRPVSRDEHSAWLPRVIADPASELFVIEEEGQAVGNVRLDRSLEELELGVSLIAQARGRGLGTKAIEAAVAYAYIRAGVDSVSATVLPSNAASLTAFEKIGFERLGRDQDGFLLLELRRRSFDWGSAPAGARA